MFDSCYPYRLAGKEKITEDKNVVCKHIYTFTSRKKNTYLAYLHEYADSVFVVKFHLKADKLNPNRYNKVLNFFEFGGVIRTVLDICLDILRKNDLASFAFMGVPKQSPNKSELKGIPGNQRFTVYKRISESLLGTNTFTHIYSETVNSYLLINNKRSATFTKSVIEEFTKNYREISQFE